MNRPSLSFVLLACLVTSCGDDGFEPGVSCDSDLDCASRVCESRECVPTCAADADCTAAFPSDPAFCASGRCMRGCDDASAFRLEPDEVCQMGRITACDAVGDEYCGDCSDKCVGQRCVDGEGCGPLVDVSGACDDDDDCRTGNCSLVTGTCRVPIGAPCTVDDCDLCFTADGGWTYCSRQCGGLPVDCPVEELCIGHSETNDFTCRPPCDDACPGSCASTSGGTSFCFGFFPMEAPRRALEPCTGACAEGEGTCLDAPYCAAECDGQRGYCSPACASDADCGSGAACVSITCAEDSDGSDCGLRCLPTCDGSFRSCNPLADADCVDVANAAGGTSSVCHPLAPSESPCLTGADCRSGACSPTLRRCLRVGGGANGQRCAVAGDCDSGNCDALHCRGSSLRGDACSTDYDCAVGTCVGDVCD